MESRTVAISQIVSGWATAVTAIIALLAAFVAYKQISVQRELFAKQIYQSYLQRAFENPDLAEGRPSAPAVSTPPEDNEKRQKQYEWFVSQLLSSIEEIMSVSNDCGWWLTARQQLLFHKDYFKSAEFLTEELPQYDAVVQQLVRDVIDDPATERNRRMRRCLPAKPRGPVSATSLMPPVLGSSAPSR